MAQVYVWRPEGVPVEEAERRFARSLDDARTTYAATYGGEFAAHRHRVGGAFVGAVTTDLGVRGWSAWVSGAGTGLAWSGVCEDLLGVTWKPSRVADTVSMLLDRPEDAMDWRGSFSVVAWDDGTGRIGVVTGGAQSQTLWRTDGPDGWACGSRARPLQEWVGRTPELDSVQASLFVSFGYLAGTGSLFRNVDRVPSRRHVALHPGRGATIREYVGLAEFLKREDMAGHALHEAVDVAAESYAARVARQHRFSRAPVLSLTGGRDSRSIAAALTHTEFSGPARTGGVPSSEDVIVAAEVARTLRLSHERTASDVSFVERFHESFGRAVKWSRLSEGLETIRHGLHYEWFFEGERPPDGPREQNFNGLRPFLNRRHAPDWQRDALRGRIRDDIRHRRDALAHFDAMVEHFDREVSAADGNPNHVADLHFWQVKVLHSGQDNILVKDMFSHWWTPLLDPTVIRANWHLRTDRLPRAAFIEALTLALAPQLEGVRYEGAPASRVQTLVRRIRRKLPRPLQPSRKALFAVSPDRDRIWESILFERDALVWKDLVEPSEVRRMLDEDRGDHLLWSLATIECFARAHLDGSDAGADRGESAALVAARAGS